jgi:hypothetical protein
MKKRALFFLSVCFFQSSFAGEGMLGGLSPELAIAIIDAQKFEYKNASCYPYTGEISIEVSAGFVSVFTHANLVIRAFDAKQKWKETQLELKTGTHRYSVNAKTMGIREIYSYSISTGTTSLIFEPCGKNILKK